MPPIRSLSYVKWPYMAYITLDSLLYLLWTFILGNTIIIRSGSCGALRTLSLFQMDCFINVHLIKDFKISIPRSTKGKNCVFYFLA